MCCCPVSVRLSVRHNFRVLSQRLNGGSRKQCRTVVQELRIFPDAKDISEIRMGSSPTGALNTAGRLKSAICDQHLAMSQKR